MTTPKPLDSAVVDGNALTLIRTFDAPRELVFDAWVDPDQLSRWWGPVGFHAPRDKVEIDARVGGVWRATMVEEATGNEYPADAVFTVFDRPSRIEMEASPNGFPANLTITFEDNGDYTLVTLVNRVSDASPEFDGMIDGWTQAFTKIDAVLDEATSSASSGGQA